MNKILKYSVFVILAWLLFHLFALLIFGLSDNYYNSDAILVFGNKVEETGEPSDRLKSRLDRAISLYNEGMTEIIVVSGALGKEGFEEAEVMKEYLMKNNIPKENIIVDNKGYTTYDTGKNFRDIAKQHDFHNVILVSQYYHLLRANLALKKFGISNIKHAKAIMPPEWRDFYSIPCEVVGYYAYLFKNYK